MSGSGARFGALLAAGVLLTGLIALVVSGSGSDEGGGPPPPRRCLEAWNSDPQAIAFGRHNSISHGYGDVQVGRMPQEGGTSLSSEPGTGECTVVFAAEQLDPEPEAAGEIQLDGEWVPLTGLLEPAALGELQSAAVEAANATVTPEGNLEQAP